MIITLYSRQLYISFSIFYVSLNFNSFFFWLYIECRAGSKEGSDSQSTGTVTSTWFWWQTWRVQVMWWMFGSKVRKPIGWWWAVTGDRTGSQTRCWLVSHSPSGSEAVIVALPLLGTLYPQIGNLVKPSPEKISEFRPLHHAYGLCLFSHLFYFSCLLCFALLLNIMGMRRLRKGKWGKV